MVFETEEGDCQVPVVEPSRLLRRGLAVCWRERNVIAGLVGVCTSEQIVEHLEWVIGIVDGVRLLTVTNNAGAGVREIED